MLNWNPDDDDDDVGGGGVVKSGGQGMEEEGRVIWTFLQAATEEILTLKLHVWRSVWDKWLLVEPSCEGFASKLGDI